MQPATFLILSLLASLCSSAQVPLRHAHSHNDYLHQRPLLDALELGFCSVEADIFLVGDALLVAHDIEKTNATRTLRNLYLEPLVMRVRTNNGHVFAAPAPFTLLIDFKSEAESTYAALAKELQHYKPILTAFTDKEIRTNAVTIVLSGNRPVTAVKAQRERLVGIDGRLPDLTNRIDRFLMPLISDNWTKHFAWKGEGPLPEFEKAKLRQLAMQAHDRGQILRFWAVPDNPAAWTQLKEAGVDLINTDDLRGLATFLRKL